MDPRARLLFAIALIAALAIPASSLADEDGDDPYAGAISATEVTHVSARVTGWLVPGDKQTTWWIGYGSSFGDVQSTARITVPGDRKRKPVSVSATLTGLAPETDVYAGMVAESDGYRSYGKVTSFRTAAAPGAAPIADDPPASAPTAVPAPDAPEPQLGKTVVLAEASGVVRVKLRGGDTFVSLEAATSIPVGSVVDARGGSVSLSAARNAAGSIQEASFGGGLFVVRQPSDGRGYTDLYLRGRGFSRCGADRGDRALASAAAKRRKRVRSLWGRDRGGRFRTHGRDSVATVRGTRWTMTDRCDGTLTTVTEGAVDVKVRRTGRTVRVSAGERHLARHRR
jgi:hypothetical protein